MSLEAVVQEAVRAVVREEMRAALRDFTGGGLSSDAPLSYKQAGSFLGCHANTVAQYVRRGLLTATGTGRMTRVKRSDLLLVLEKLAAPAVVETSAQIATRILNTSKPRKGKS